MEKSEPTFVPEWLKGSGGGITSHKMMSSLLPSDDYMATKTSRYKSSPSVNDEGIGSYFVEDRTTSSYFRWSSSSNGSSLLQSQGTFGRSNRDRDWEEIIVSPGKEKHFLSDRRHKYSDPLGSILPSRFDKDLRRSQSIFTGKQGDTFPRKISSYSGNANKSSALQTGVSALSSVHKASFGRDFPSLGTEERQGSEIRRVSPIGLSSGIPSMSLGAFALTRGETWTSALAEVPVVAVRNEIVSVQQVASVTVSLASSLSTGLNMAETVSQGSSRAQTSPQLSAETHRLEELAIKQSKQLIPVMPSMPKALSNTGIEREINRKIQAEWRGSASGVLCDRNMRLRLKVLNSSEKSKAKLGLPHIPSSNVSSHSPRSAPVTPVLLKLPSLGKLQILKPAQGRNGILTYSKDSSSPTSVSTVLPSTTVAIGSAPSKSPLEKKLTPQARSRNDFFNLMRKKSVTSPSSTPTGPGFVSFNSDNSGTASPVMSLDGDSLKLGSSFGDRASRGSDYKCNGSSSETPMEYAGDKVSKSVLNEGGHSSSSAILSSEEEEAVFLRSLGWEENGGEDESLTEEEISSFFQEMDEYIKLRPPSKVIQAMQPKLLESLNVHYGSFVGGASSGSSSSDSKSEI